MWINKAPEYGDHIRVNRGLYYHHGIYESDSTVYQFAAPSGSEINEQNAKIIITTLEEFLKGGELEVREFSLDELKEKRTPQEIISEAYAHVGSREGGYDLINNNCEHFANRCVFGKSTSEQVENVLSFLKGMFGGK